MSHINALDDSFQNLSEELQQNFGDKLNKQQLAKCVENLAADTEKMNLKSWTDSKLKAKFDTIADVLVGEAKERGEMMQPKIEALRDLQDLPLGEISNLNTELLENTIKIKALEEEQQRIDEAIQKLRTALEEIKQLQLQLK